MSRLDATVCKNCHEEVYCTLSEEGEADWWHTSSKNNYCFVRGDEQAEPMFEWAGQLRYGSGGAAWIGAVRCLVCYALVRKDDDDEHAEFHGSLVREEET